jgi:hypothetical protein
MIYDIPRKAKLLVSFLTKSLSYDWIFFYSKNSDCITIFSIFLNLSPDIYYICQSSIIYIQLLHIITIQLSEFIILNTKDCYLILLSYVEKI